MVTENCHLRWLRHWDLAVGLVLDLLSSSKKSLHSIQRRKHYFSPKLSLSCHPVELEISALYQWLLLLPHHTCPQDFSD